jgi:hypothetical protein
MTTDALLAAYDEQLRTDAEMARAQEVVREGPLLWGVFDHGGFVSYRDLGGLEGQALDALIERTVADSDPKKPATCTSPGRREAQEWARSSCPRPTDHESPMTRTGAPSPVTIAARALESARCCWHRAGPASAVSAT